MLFEILMCGTAVIAFGGLTLKDYFLESAKANKPPMGIQLFDENDKQIYPKLEQKSAETDVGKLVIELLRTDEGWTHKNSKKWDNEFFHNTGLQVYHKHQYIDYGYGDRYDYDYVCVNVLDEEGKKYEAAEIGNDGKYIAAELIAYKTRERSAKQKRLSAALAKRILDRESGVLAGPGMVEPDVPQEVDRDKLVPKVRDDTTGVLRYDVETKQLITTVRGDRVILEMDDSVAKRYGLNKPYKGHFDSQKSARQYVNSLKKRYNNGAY